MRIGNLFVAGESRSSRKTNTALKKKSKWGMLLLGDDIRMTKENNANCVFVTVIHRCNALTPMLEFGR